VAPLAEKGFSHPPSTCQVPLRGGVARLSRQAVDDAQPPIGLCSAQVTKVPTSQGFQHSRPSRLIRHPTRRVIQSLGSGDPRPMCLEIGIVPWAIAFIGGDGSTVPAEQGVALRRVRNSVPLVLAKRSTRHH